MIYSCRDRLRMDAEVKFVKNAKKAKCEVGLDSIVAPGRGVRFSSPRAHDTMRALGL